MIILDFLPHIHISYIYQTFDLKRVGQVTKEIKLNTINPISGIKEEIAVITATINLDISAGNDFLDLEFWYSGKLQKQRIDLVVKRSSLKKGNVFYLVCPATEETKRKLFLHNGKFISRKAINNSYYAIEVHSNKQRRLISDSKKLIWQKKTLQGEKKRYFKKYYNGFPTKKYLKVLEAAKELNASW